MNDVIEKFSEIYKKYPLLVNLVVLIATAVIKHYEQSNQQSEKTIKE